MPTERLYYTDPYLIEFDAEVLAVREHEGRRAVILDRTAFYPASGGQPFDRGTLGGAAVLEVEDAEDGTILHVVDGPVARGRVGGRIDWPRRFDHMQQHTGQHILSAAFDRLFTVRTAAFHLGATASTIDLAREVTPAEIAAAEDEANRIVWADEPVRIRFVDAEQAAGLPLRKESSRTGELRIVEIGTFDTSACGGTHVARTGGVGIVVASRWERFRSGTRLEFRCGARALGEHRDLREMAASAGRLLSTGAGEVAAGVERLLAENRDLRRRTRDVQARVARLEADRLAAAAEPRDGVRLACAILDAADAPALKAIASALVEHAQVAAALVTAAEPRAVVVARAPGVAADAGATVRALLERFGGKGGGRPELAQAVGLAGPAEEILAAAARLLTTEPPRSA